MSISPLVKLDSEDSLFVKFGCCDERVGDCELNSASARVLVVPAL